MTLVRSLLVGALLAAFLAPRAAEAQQATPGADSTPHRSEPLSPVELYDALLETPIPEALLPDGVGRFEPYEWQDSNDADLAGSIGGVVYADGDPFASQLPNGITYLVYPDPSGPETTLSTLTKIGVPRDIMLDQQTIPALLADTGEFVGLFAAVNNVLIYGYAPTSPSDEDTAAALAEAGIIHLLRLTGGTAAGSIPPAATPGAGTSGVAKDLLLALAAVPFPQDELPLAVGSLVVLPMDISGRDAERDIIAALLVRDADRRYTYPLVFYEFYASDAAARRAVSPSTSAQATPTLTVVPSSAGLPYAGTILDSPSETTEVRVQAGPVVIIGNAPRGSLEERHSLAMTLARIAVTHLEGVAHAEGISLDDLRMQGSLAPDKLHAALLAATFPPELLPSGIGALDTQPWQDSSEPILAQAIGGVTYSQGDTLSLEPVHTIAVAVFSTSSEAEASMADAVLQIESFGVQPLACTGAEGASLAFSIATTHACLVQFDNVIVSGTVIALDDRPASEKSAVAKDLALAGMAFVETVAAPA